MPLSVTIFIQLYWFFSRISIGNRNIFVNFAEIRSVEDTRIGELGPEQGRKTEAAAGNCFESAPQGKRPGHARNPQRDQPQNALIEADWDLPSQHVLLLRRQFTPLSQFQFFVKHQWPHRQPF